MQTNVTKRINKGRGFVGLRITRGRGLETVEALERGVDSKDRE